MAKAAKNYLKMHHPSLYKKMYGKGGKVKEGYKKGGYVSEFTYDPMPLRRNKVDLLQESIKANPEVDRGRIVYGGDSTPESNALLSDHQKRVAEARAKYNVQVPNPGYAGGGQVNKAQALQGMGDVVDAKLTPGEIVLNADQQVALEQELGQPIDGLMAKIGVPGCEGGGKVEMEYRGGGKVDKKKKALLRYN